METLSLVPNASWMIPHGQSTAWTKEDNKQFESALAIFDEKTPNRWFKVAAMIPGKSVYDVINQYRELVADVSDIEAGLVPIPGYLASSFTLELGGHRGFDVYGKRGRSCDQQRKKGVPWTEDEHRRFLMGLQKHGKGDWRNISRNFVVSKTPTQVASHAQKYYLRQLSGSKDKRRSSIHDINTFDLKETCCPIEANKHHLLGIKSDEVITSFQNPTKIVMEWNQKDGAPLVAFDSDSYIAKHILNIGHDSSPGFHFKSPTFYG